MREIIFDTETTGLDPNGDRLVEIGCVEVVNQIPTGRNFHVYLKPGVRMSVEAERIHGLTEAFLADKPSFSEIVDDFLKFIDGAALVAHNATFDMEFLNAELRRIGQQPVDPGRMVDTLMLARRRHPAGPNSLDALCNRYGIDLSRRTLHGALLDATLLAEVYVELRGGRQAALGLGYATSDASGATNSGTIRVVIGPRPVPRPLLVGAADLAAHAGLLGSLGGEPLWRSYLPAPPAQ